MSASFKVIGFGSKSITDRGGCKLFDLVEVDYRGHRAVFAKRRYPQAGQWIQVVPKTGDVVVSNPVLIALLDNELSKTARAVLTSR